MTKQQKTVLQKWAKALRSGEYQQGERSLHKQDREGRDSYCCLGVLCDLALEAGVLTKDLVKQRSEAGVTTFHYGEEDSSGLLPTAVKRWAGLQTRDGSLFGPTLGVTSLAALNDAGMTFEAIARLIESKPNGLFY